VTRLLLAVRAVEGYREPRNWIPGALYQARASSLLSLAGSHALKPCVHVLSDLIFSEAVPLLDFAFELIAPTIYLRQVIVCELAPFLLNFAAELFPTASDSIPIHSRSSLS